VVGRIAIIDGHPDPDPKRFVHALAGAYAEGAAAGGHQVRRISVAELDFPLIGSRHDWESDYRPASIRHAQETIQWADHLLIVYPLWLGDMPALLKAFFEQVMRPDYAFSARSQGLPKKLLKGRSAHVAVTMGMPALFYRVYYGAHSLRSLERNILKFVGIFPVHHSIIGSVDGDAESREGWLQEMFGRGEAGD
jgi:putative NADPH-quinone reductase